MNRFLLALLGVLYSFTAGAQSTDWFTYQNSALTNGVVTVKGSPGPLLGYICYNPNAVAAYVQIFDSTTGVVLGTTVAKRVLQVPGLTSTGLQTPNPPFSGAVGLQVAATSTSSGGAAPSSAISCEFYYR